MAVGERLAQLVLVPVVQAHSRWSKSSSRPSAALAASVIPVAIDPIEDFCGEKRSRHGFQTAPTVRLPAENQGMGQPVSR
jgi:hypothetical protein